MRRPISILLIEDSADDADLLQAELARGGYDPQITRVETAEAMSEALERGGFELILSDYSLPRFTGMAALQMLRSRGLDIPFVLVSGTIGEERAVAAMKAGADDYVMKGRLARIVPVIQRELREVEIRRARTQAEAELRRAHAELEVRVAERTQELSTVNAALSAEIELRKATEADLREAYAVAEHAKRMAHEANDAKSIFLANMSHEIRTPMSAIIGYTDLMLEPGCDPSDRLNHLNVVRRNADHLLSLINDILDLSKIEAGQMEVESITCSPTQIVGEVASIMRVRAGEKNIQFDVTLHGELPRVIHSDPIRLRQILINLIGNAIKFTERGSVRVNVHFDAGGENPAPALRFDVIDSGIGMSEEEVGRLFQPFSQANTSTARRFGGTGLGLAISRRLADKLGGAITVRSRPGEGSTFSLAVPVGSLEGIELVSATVEANRRDAGLSTDDPRLAARILLAEDGPDNRKLLSGYLTRAGATVELAENGLVALQKATEAMEGGAPFDLIVMDMRMPELDGYLATAKLRERGFDGPIIALTAHAMADDRAKCLRAGCTDYLSKPVRRAALLGAIDRLLNGGGGACEGGEQPTIACDTGAIEPELMRFLPSFMSNLPNQVDELSRQLRNQNIAGVDDIVHQLKGSSGMFGFRRMSDRAAAAERAIESGQMEDIHREVNQLIEYIRRVEGYDHGRETERAA